MSRLFWIVLAFIGGGLILLIVNDSSGTTLGMQNDAFGRTLYLGIWGGVVAAGLIGSGIGFGAIARNLGIWMLLILVLVAGYQYRYELQDIASRVTVGLVPGSPLSISDSDGRQTVMLEKRPNGHFEARLTINGATVQALVDTGASSTVLTTEDARRAGFDPSALSFTVPVSTANGTARAARVVADEIHVGAILRSKVQVLVAEPHALNQSLLGMNFIGTLSGFDIRGDRMTLRD